jgi:hypothetical protein
VKVKRIWSAIGWVTKNLLSRAPPCFGRHVKPLVPAAFAVVSTHQSALGQRGYGPFSLWVIHKEGLCPSSGGINSLMIHTYVPLTLYLQRGSRGISDIPPRPHVLPKLLQLARVLVQTASCVWSPFIKYIHIPKS